MEMFKVQWTDADGSRMTSVVSYDAPSAHTAKQQKEQAGMQDVEVIEDQPLG